MAYGGVFLMLSVTFNALWIYASKGKRLLHDHISDEVISRRLRRSLLGIVLYGAAIPLALVSAWISIGIYVGLALLYLIPTGED